MRRPTLPRETDVLIVGGGQAGLSLSWHLVQSGTDHVVVERDAVAHEWRSSRWDTFCLVTPNWQCALPGYPYAGDDPDGFMVKDEIIAYLEGYAASFTAPVVDGVAVTSLRPCSRGRFDVTTTAGDVSAGSVVVATGGYHEPIIPTYASRLPGELVQLHSSSYRNPSQLPPGDVLVVGTGQSGAQIAEDLHLAGRHVHLSVGTAPRCARFHRGRDVVTWLADMGTYDLPLTEHPLGEEAAHRTNHYVTGRDGGRDIDLRVFAADGMALYGRLVGESAGRLQFAPDLRENLDSADAVYVGINEAIDAHIAKHAISAPPGAPYTPPWEPAGETTELVLQSSGITSVVWAIGFRPDYSWLHADVLDGHGRPRHVRGVTDVEGLLFLGLPWLHTWGSGRFASVGRDAAYLHDVLRRRLDRAGLDLAGGALLPAS